MLRKYIIKEFYTVSICYSLDMFDFQTLYIRSLVLMVTCCGNFMRWHLIEDLNSIRCVSFEERSAPVCLWAPTSAV